jgi:putative endonuclease
MAGWVYILPGSTGRYYIGSTTDLERRLSEHTRGSCHTTKRLGEVSLIESIELPTIHDARLLERRLKAMKNPAKAIEFVRKAKS